MHNRRLGRVAFILFLLGLGSETKTYIYGCLAFSEFVVFVAAPILLLKQYAQFRKCGLLQPIGMIIGLMIAMLVSSWINDTPIPFVIKSFAVMYGVLSYYIVLSHLLKANPKGLGWFFVGYALSCFITIFAFNPQAIVSVDGSGFIGDAEADDIINGPLFWVQKLKAIWQIPIMGWYLQTPLAYSMTVPIAYTIFLMFTTISGRSASLSALFGVALMFLGRRSRRSMRTVSRHFFLVVFSGLVVALAYKAVYGYAAGNGILGTDAQTKYEGQTKAGHGLLAMLMSGRKEFFMAIPAALDNPIWGYGPHAEDKNEYALRFLFKYGDDLDVAKYQAAVQIARQVGFRMLIPSHSHIMGAWVHYGIFGLIFYCWLLFVIYRHLRKYVHVIPQWYGYFSIWIGVYLWHIFFSSPGSRVMLGMFIATLFVAKAVGDGRVQLPYELEMEARKHDR